MYYVIQVGTGQENKAIEDIRKYNTNGGDIDVFAPTRKSMRKYKGQWIEYIEPCFPGYVFVDTDDAKGLFFDLYWVPGFQKLLGREGLTYHFNPLNEEESRMIDILYSKNTGHITEISDIEVEEGDIIRVLDGPLMDMKGRVKKVNLHKRYVVIEMELFNQLFDVKLGVNIVTKVEQ